MATHSIDTIQTETGISSDVITLHLGISSVRVYTHGAINTLHHNAVDITAQRSLNTQLVKFTEVFKQRGGNPIMGPMAGRYGDEADPEQPAQRIAQPGAVDIHGVFAGLLWHISEINDKKGYVELVLPANEWKTELKNYYFFAAQDPEEYSERRQALDRLIRATSRRYPNDYEVGEHLNSLRSLIQRANEMTSLGSIHDEIEYLIEIAYSGEADIIRRITIEDIQGEKVASFLDEVWFRNNSLDSEYRDASGYHTYFNALLKEIVMPQGFWGGSVPAHYDDNISDVRVREIDQRQRLGRRIFIAPEGELQIPAANQIIYKDPSTVGISEVALENWRQRGDGHHFPEVARVIRPGESSRIGIRIIVVEGDEVPDYIQEYITDVNSLLTPES